ncbi:S41 family peptidase [Gelidibacter sp. F2691]|nr:S41 family peptidase [Gelidibacter sp. F2691]
MKKTIVILLILNLSINASAQKHQTSQDSIKAGYDAIFTKLQEGFIYKDSVNWNLVKAETASNLANYSDFKTSLNEIVPLFSKINATHCAVLYKDNTYSVPVTMAPESLNDQWKKKYATHPNLETKVIGDKYGYILLPALSFPDTRPRNVNKISQKLYDQINDLKNNTEIEGWIIDLRFNTGGHSWPMLLALYDFLGDNNISATLDSDKKQIGMARLSNGNYVVDSNINFKIKPKGKLLDTAKVAIITGVATASSGEVVAMAFKHRPHTIFIGEKSAGFTSANNGAVLPFGMLMILTKTYSSDRNGNYYDHIMPDIRVSKQDNFDDLLLDQNIQESIKFIKSEK